MKRLILTGAVTFGLIGVIPAQATSYPAGDANCSGSVTMADAGIALNIYLQKITDRSGCDSRIDMNCDGKITTADANIIQRIYFHLPVQYPEICED